MFGGFRGRSVHFLGDIERGGFNFGLGERGEEFFSSDQREHSKILVMLARRLKMGYGSMQGFEQQMIM